MNHIKALDSIRAIAVLLVIVGHWLDKSYFTATFYPGGIGVAAFFVLSGFLITTILLQNRLEAEGQGNSKGQVVKNFFIRRSLRIFPVYYLTIFILLAFSDATDTHIKENFIYFLTYTSNFYFYKRQAWDGMLSHLWSLAVEEQFYLFWPWIILYTPKKHLLSTLIVFVAIGVLSGYLVSNNPIAITLPFASFDSFGLGALLAFMLALHKNSLASMYRLLSVVAAACFLMILSNMTPWPTFLLPIKTVHSLLALWLITHIVLRQEQQRKHFPLLTNSILIFLGRISYGLYLYHLPIAWDYAYLNKYLNYRLPAFISAHTSYVVFAENLVLLTLLAWASWVLVERPLLRLKKYFHYQEAASLPVASRI